MIYLIDSNINLISLIMIQKSWRTVIFPWKREKLNYRMSDRSFCQYDESQGQISVIRGQVLARKGSSPQTSGPKREKSKIRGPFWAIFWLSHGPVWEFRVMKFGQKWFLVALLIKCKSDCHSFRNRSRYDSGRASFLSRPGSKRFSKPEDTSTAFTFKNKLALPSAPLI